ncbi:MAG: hypothetical protein J2P37_27625, partial [Ktedonobacteraceae bacterium]|nr:hypothetical protein [Ktedonobacteraceae bacterium]
MAVNPARNIQFRHYLRVEGDPEGGIHLYFGHQHSYWNPYGQFEQRLFPLLDGSRTCDEIIEKMQLADPTITPDQVSTYLEVMQYPDDPDDPNPGPGLIEYAAPGDAGLPLSLLKEMDRHLAYLSLRNRTGEGGAILQRK